MVRGYWIVRLVEKKQPGFWKRFFSRGLGIRTAERELAEALEIAPQDLWAEIDGRIVARFGAQGT